MKLITNLAGIDYKSQLKLFPEVKIYFYLGHQMDASDFSANACTCTCTPIYHGYIEMKYAAAALNPQSSTLNRIYIILFRTLIITGRLVPTIRLSIK